MKTGSKVLWNVPQVLFLLPDNSMWLNASPLQRCLGTAWKISLPVSLHRSKGEWDVSEHMQLTLWCHQTIMHQSLNSQYYWILREIDHQFIFLPDEVYTFLCTAVMDISLSMDAKTVFLYPTVCLFSDVKLDILTWWSKETDSLLEPAPSGQ